MKSQVHKETKKRVIIFSMIYFNKEIEEVTKTFSWDKEYCRERFCEFCFIKFSVAKRYKNILSKDYSYA